MRLKSDLLKTKVDKSQASKSKKKSGNIKGGSNDIEWAAQNLEDYGDAHYDSFDFRDGSKMD